MKGYKGFNKFQSAVNGRPSTASRLCASENFLKLLVIMPANLKNPTSPIRGRGNLVAYGKKNRAIE